MDERAFHRAMEPLVRFQKLSAVLVQWPWSFKNTVEHCRILSDLLSRFSAYPLAVEFRHASWASKEVLRLLREKDAAFCNIDQPDLAHCLRPHRAPSPRRWPTSASTGATPPPGSPRAPGGDERYNYLYSASRAGAVGGDRPRGVRRRPRTVVAIFNNHFRGKAVANACQLLHALVGPEAARPRRAPRDLPRSWKAISSTVFQRSLFGRWPCRKRGASSLLPARIGPDRSLDSIDAQGVVHGK